MKDDKKTGIPEYLIWNGVGNKILNIGNENSDGKVIGNMYENKVSVGLIEPVKICKNKKCVELKLQNPTYISKDTMKIYWDCHNIKDDKVYCKREKDFKCNLAKKSDEDCEFGETFTRGSFEYKIENEAIKFTGSSDEKFFLDDKEVGNLIKEIIQGDTDLGIFLKNDWTLSFVLFFHSFVLLII